jgi:hypothetical protein
MTRKEAEKKARIHLGKKLKLEPGTPPLNFKYRNQNIEDKCHWFSVHFANEYTIGAGRVIGIRKTTGKVAYFGTDGGE